MLIPGLVASQASAGTDAPAGLEYYLDETVGSDAADGSEGAPFDTLDFAVSVLQPGDTLWVKNGNYTKWGSVSLTGGTSWSLPVTIKAYPGHMPRIAAASGVVLEIEVEYAIVSGFEVDGTGGGTTGVWVQADHIQVELCDVHHGSASGIVNSGFADSRFLNNDVHDHGDTVNLDHGFYISGPQLQVIGNHVWNCAAIGIQVYHSSGGVDWSDGALIEGNFVHHNAVLGSGSGILLGIGKNHTIINNIVAHGHTAGIKIGSFTDGPSLIAGNTFIGPATNGGIWIDWITDNEVRNNIIYGFATAVSLTNGASATQSNNLTADPLFAHSALLLPPHFKVTSGSGALNAGVAVSAMTHDYFGTARGSPPEIGAYEGSAVAAITPNFTLVGRGFVDASALAVASQTVTFRNLADSADYTAQPGDLIVAVIFGDTTRTFERPGGWSSLIAQQGHTGKANLKARVVYKVVTAALGSQEFRVSGGTSSAWSVAVAILRDAHPVSPFNVLSATFAEGSSSTPTAPDVTTTVAATKVLRIGFTDSTTLGSPPAGHTGILWQGGSFTSCGLAWEEQAEAGAPGTAAFTGTGNAQWLAATIAVQPLADLSAIFTPEEFGWSAGGTIANNTTALQDAIDAATANSGGGTVELVAGRSYVVNASIFGASQVTISTAGGTPKASIKLDPALDAGDPVSFVPVLRIEDVQDFSLVSLIIDGSRDDITNIVGAGDAGLHCIRINGGEGIFFQDVEAIEAVTDGLYLDGSLTGPPASNSLYYVTNFLATGCRFDLNGRNGVTIAGCGRDAATWDQVVFDDCQANQNGDKPSSTLGTQPGSGWHFETTYGPTWEHYRGITLTNCRGNGNRGSTRINYGTPGSLNWGAGLIFMPAVVDSGGEINYCKIENLTLDGNRLACEFRLYGDPTGAVVTDTIIDGITILNTTFDPNRILIWDKDAPPENSTVEMTITGADVDTIGISGLALTGNDISIDPGEFAPVITTNDIATVTIAGGYTPAQFPNCTGWWTADDLAAISDGADVTSWTSHAARVPSSWNQRASGALPDKALISSEHFVDFAAASSESLDNAFTLDTLVGGSGFCALVFELTATPTRTSANWYDNHGLISDAGGYWGISVDNIGATPHVVAGVYDGSAKKISHTVTVGSRHVFMMWRTSGGTLTSVLDSGSEQTLSAGAPSVLTGAMQLGCNYSAVHFANMRLMAVITSRSIGTTTDRSNLLTYLQAI